jgi:8-oxo-dGTP pyrophosphatase MutT (NUDIX family)
MSKLRIRTIEGRLGAHAPVLLDDQIFDRRAAVAAILRERGGDTEVLFIKRAQRPGDIWSGHMAFPGGHWEPSDQDLAQTAVRETREEIGLDLGRHGRLLGHLDHMRVNPIGASYEMLIVPYLFEALGELPEFSLSHEVAAVHWGSMHSMFDGRSSTSRDLRIASGTHNFPGFRVQQEIVWGLTYQMLQSLFRLLK